MLLIDKNTFPALAAVGTITLILGTMIGILGTMIALNIDAKNSPIESKAKTEYIYNFHGAVESAEFYGGYLDITDSQKDGKSLKANSNNPNDDPYKMEKE